MIKLLYDIALGTIKIFFDTVLDIAKLTFDEMLKKKALLSVIFLLAAFLFARVFLSAGKIVKNEKATYARPTSGIDSGSQDLFKRLRAGKDIDECLGSGGISGTDVSLGSGIRCPNNIHSMIYTSMRHAFIILTKPGYDPLAFLGTPSPIDEDAKAARSEKFRVLSIYEIKNADGSEIKVGGLDAVIECYVYKREILIMHGGISGSADPEKLFETFYNKLGKPLLQIEGDRCQGVWRDGNEYLLFARSDFWHVRIEKLNELCKMMLAMAGEGPQDKDKRK